MGKNRQLSNPRCGHAYSMQWSTLGCWCGECGQTWKWIDDRGWYALDMSEASFGERTMHSRRDYY